MTLLVLLVAGIGGLIVGEWALHTRQRPAPTRRRRR